MAVQERLGLVFQTFLKVRTVAKVMRVLNDRGLDLPRRDRHGDLRWARATISAVAAILKNPAYAGAFVYGRTRLRKPSDGKIGKKVARPIEEWRIVVKDRYPAYIDWPTYEKIRDIVSDNRAEYMRIKTRGAPRDGDLLLHGIAWCGGAATRCTFVTKAAGSMSATICAPMRACRRASTSGLRAWMPPWPCVPDRAGTRRARCAVARPPRPEPGRHGDAASMRNASSSARDTPRRWPNVSSTASIPTIVLSRPSSSAAGRRR